MSYNIEWRPVGGATTSVTGITDLFYDLTGLTAAEDYEFRVQEDDGTALSGWSDWFAFTTSSLVIFNFSLSETAFSSSAVQQVKSISRSIAQSANVSHAVAWKKLGRVNANQLVRIDDNAAVKKQSAFGLINAARIQNVFAQSKKGVAQIIERARIDDNSSATKLGRLTSAQTARSTSTVANTKLSTFAVSERAEIACTIRLAGMILEFNLSESASAQAALNSIKVGRHVPTENAQASGAGVFRKTGRLTFAKRARTITAAANRKAITFNASENLTLGGQVTQMKVMSLAASGKATLLATAAYRKAGVFNIAQGAGLDVTVLMATRLRLFNISERAGVDVLTDIAKYGRMTVNQRSTIDAAAQSTKLGRHAVVQLARADESLMSVKLSTYSASQRVLADTYTDVAKQINHVISNAATTSQSADATKLAIMSVDHAVFANVALDWSKISGWEIEQSSGLSHLAEYTKFAVYDIDEQGHARINIFMGEGYRTSAIFLPVTDVNTGIRAEGVDSLGRFITMPVTQLTREITL